jgi:uncharacterized protein
MSRWESLLTVQGHDTHVDQLKHRLASLPGRAELARNAEALAVLDERIAAVESRRTDLSRSQQRLEDEVASLTEKATQADKRLYSGTVSNPRELQALQDDIASIKRRISQIEDDELEIMELTEPVEAEQAELDGERATLAAEGDRLRAEVADAESSIAAELASVQAERDAAAAEVPDELWSEYDKLRAARGGVAIARLVGPTCQGCHLSLPAAEVDRIKHLPADEPVHCEECGRLLVHG